MTVHPNTNPLTRMKHKGRAEAFHFLAKGTPTFNDKLQFVVGRDGFPYLLAPRQQPERFERVGGGDCEKEDVKGSLVVLDLLG